MPCRNLTVGTTCIGFSGGHSEPLSFPLFTQLTDEGAVHFHVNCYLFGTSGTLINAVMQWTPQCMSRSRPTNPCSSYTGSLNKPIPFFLVSSQLPHFLLLCCAFCLFPDFGFCWSCFCAGWYWVNRQQWSWSPLRSWGIIQVAAESGSHDSYVLERRGNSLCSHSEEQVPLHNWGHHRHRRKEQQLVQHWFDIVP